MPTVRSEIARRGDFVRALYILHEEPTLENLMLAYAIADGDNRTALNEAARVWTDGVDLHGTFKTWLRSGMTTEIRKALEREFEVIARLDEDVKNPFEVPIRRGGGD